VSETLERAAELTKLARLLGVEQKDLSYLERLPAESLREFRLQATDRLFDGDAGRLKRVAAASKLVPVPLTVKISQIAFGPVLCAATAGLLDPPHAVKIATRCPTSFLADITIHLDPRRAAGVIGAVPGDLVAAVAVELIERGEHVTTGRFVSYLSPRTLRASIDAIADDADLLRVAFVMEGKDNLDELIDIARHRLAGIVRTAYEQDLWPEALDLIGHVSLATLAEIAEVTAAEGDEVLTALVRAAHENDAWDALLPVTAAMTPESLERFATLPAVREDEVLRRIVETAVSGPGWVALLPLTTRLPRDVRVKVAAQVAELDDATLERLATEAHESEHWDALLPIALAFDDDARRRLAGLPLLQREDVLRAAIHTAARHDLWDAALPLVDALPEAAKPLIAPIVAELKLPADKQKALLDQARAAGYEDIVAALTPKPAKKPAKQAATPAAKSPAKPAAKKPAPKPAAKKPAKPAAKKAPGTRAAAKPEA
jgi:predicted HTH domain antitoxin